MLCSVLMKAADCWREKKIVVDPLFVWTDSSWHIGFLSFFRSFFFKAQQSILAELLQFSRMTFHAPGIFRDKHQK